jgi:energy-coupling factor transporter ATP-binding protein EcfA2
MIEARDIWAAYTDTEPVLRGVNLKVDQGITALVGPNGGGKTTLLKVLAGLHPPLRGEVLIDLKNPWRLPEGEAVKVRRTVIYVHEKPLALKATVLENVTYGLRVRGVDIRVAENRALSALRRLGIEGLAYRRFNQLSAGQAQLVAIARAIAVEPRYLLLDEPTANLDTVKRRLAVALIKELASNGMGVVIATHDRLLALQLAERAVLLEEGEVRREGRPEVVLEAS